ncbi:GIY-YIG nuclease family protein [Geomonas edaphica]|uniref:GIY-YIG nuclease family protein n=1 Tax=Geomonas edaphica TaxID=2570226 RepID=UPI0010A8F85A|nr:GIY-YIG nuclease family protein [Geomonas edaphica]
MKFFDFLNVIEKDITPDQCKIHLAVHNGDDDPLDVYLEGWFEEWQSWQSKRNFERPYIISLIKFNGDDKWLFAGLYRSLESTYHQQKQYYQYRTESVASMEEYAGRLIVSFARSGRQSYLNAENWHEQLIVSEMKAKRIEIEQFPGYANTIVPKSKLDLIVGQEVESWKAALSNVGGVYLITDTTTGKCYVGSATGEGGIWQRWADYANSGHGGNLKLQKLLNVDCEYCNHFHFSILEIADTHTSVEDILQREAHWKNVLCTREHGYNAN